MNFYDETITDKEAYIRTIENHLERIKKLQSEISKSFKYTTYALSGLVQKEPSTF